MCVYFYFIGLDCLYPNWTVATLILKSTLGIAKKALNGIQWRVAHPLTLNHEVPMGSMDATICVSSAGIPYVDITNLKPFVIYKL